MPQAEVDKVLGAFAAAIVADRRALLAEDKDTIYAFNAARQVNASYYESWCAALAALRKLRGVES